MPQSKLKLFTGGVLVERFLKGEADIQAEREWVAELRLMPRRPKDISRFMRCFNEQIALQANKEDRCKGRFRVETGRILDPSPEKTHSTAKNERRKREHNHNLAPSILGESARFAVNRSKG